VLLERERLYEVIVGTGIQAVRAGVRHVFGEGRVGRVDVDFLSGPKPTGTFQAPSSALVAEKEDFGSSPRARWFGR
jgi:sulfide:quinone oxidoreductase